MSDRLTGGPAVAVLRKVYHARRDEMPGGWEAQWRSGSMTLTLRDGYDAAKAVKELRDFEEGAFRDNQQLKEELKRINHENSFIAGGSCTKKYLF